MPTSTVSANHTGQVTDTRDGIVVDYELEAGIPADAPRLAPAVERPSQ